jgi:DNA methylase
MHQTRTTTGNLNKLSPLDREAHNWFRFVLSFPPHLVREYLDRFGVGEGQYVLDPFAGTGTTLVEAKKHGVVSFGIEANPIAHFSAQVKTDWSGDPDTLMAHAYLIAEAATAELDADGIDDDNLPLLRRNWNEHSQEHQVRRALRSLLVEQEKLLLTNSISPLPLHKTLVLLDHMQHQHDEKYSRYERLALADALVSSISNLHFGPEVGVGPMKPDAPVIGPWLHRVAAIATDLRTLGAKTQTSATVHLADARHVSKVLAPHSIDAVITSPPYPNEKDYTRTTRLESVLLGFVQSRADLQALKRGLVRSNTRGVYKGDQDDIWITGHPEIERIAEAIETRRIELGKTSGFERLYAKVTKLYFGGMAQHLADLRAVLRPGARLAYVVGDQASYLRIMIRTGQLLADIASSLGYEVEGIDLFRTRLATATREQLREEVVVLRWPGPIPREAI